MKVRFQADENIPLSPSLAYTRIGIQYYSPEFQRCLVLTF
jgi:hypothetical protein